MQLSDSPQVSESPSSTYRHRRHRRRCRPPPSPTTSSVSPHSATPDITDITENQVDSSSSSLPATSTISSSHSTPPIFLSAVVPLPIFRGLPGECPVAHLTLFNRLFPSDNASSPTQISRNFAITLSDNAALWHELAVEPHPSMSWDETKDAFLRAFRLPKFADGARTELVSLRQRDGESVTAYHLRMQWILKRWQDHRLPESLVRGLFVDGLREELHDWVVPKRPETLEEAVTLAMEWEGAGRMREERVRRKMRGEERSGGEEEVATEEEEVKVGRVVSIGRSSQCQCWKHQCWKKYERSGSAATVRTANAGKATAAAAVAGPVGAVSSAERIGGTMMTVGLFFLNIFFLCLLQL